MSLHKSKYFHFLHFFLRVYLLCHFHLPYIDLICSGIFRFSNKEDGQILFLCLIMKNSVRYVVPLTCIKRLTQLQRSCQQMVVSFFFFFFFCISTRWFFNRSGEICFLGSGKLNSVVITFLMLKQRCKNFLTFLLSFLVDFNWLLLSEIIRWFRGIFTR